MKISCRNNQIFIRKNGWIVGNSVNFHPENVSHIINRIFGGAVNLWDTAERVGVLNMFFRAVDQFAVFKNISDPLCSFDLPAMVADLLNEIMKRLNPAIEGIQRKGADDVG